MYKKKKHLTNTNVPSIRQTKRNHTDGMVPFRFYDTDENSPSAAVSHGLKFKVKRYIIYVAIFDFTEQNYERQQGNARHGADW